MDLILDKEAFATSSRELKEKCEELNALRTNIKASFEQLRIDWDTDAGKKFFERFETDLIKNLEDYSKVFEHMSNNLSAASMKYEEVFNAADAVASAQF